MNKLAVMTTTLVLLSFGVAHANELAASQITITPQASRGSTKGPAAYFTGSASVQQLFGPAAPARSSAGLVTFEAGARSAWHMHPLGQTLIVTSGKGWVQEWGGEKKLIVADDVVWCPPGVKHWHGATATDGMSHIAIQETLDGKNVEWMEKVSDAQYYQ
jgi:quercetin dioxygenase-like cupin family protein